MEKNLTDKGCVLGVYCSTCVTKINIFIKFWIVSVFMAYIVFMTHIVKIIEMYAKGHRACYVCDRTLLIGSMLGC